MASKWVQAKPEKLSEVTRWAQQLTTFGANSHDRLHEDLTKLQKDKLTNHEHTQSKDRTERRRIDRYP
jgi:hypothetical protein